MLNLLWALLGAAAGGAVHAAANALGAYGSGRRAVVLAAVTAVLFALLPARLPATTDRWMTAVYVAILLLIAVTDVAQRRIPNVIVWPATALALLASLGMSAAENTLPAALLGAGVGLLFLALLYGIGRGLFGPGALGAGDVKLALLLGAMLGAHRILPALALGLLGGGLLAFYQLLRSRGAGGGQTVPLGATLAVAGIVLLLWGRPIVDWYLK